ncbi:MAG TPA: FtsX-like permease family protein [Gemmatimonadales bacterium]|nr:FtsX-like permease family protein [Gemmatimonadales bacterium]
MLSLLLVATLVASDTLPVAAPIGIAVERRLAETAALAVGDTVEVLADAGVARRAVIAAIYEPVADPATIMRRDLRARFHLADLAELLGRPDRVDRIGVALHQGIGADTAARRLDTGAFGYAVLPTAEVSSRSSTTFLVVSRFHRAIAIIAILASAIFLLCLMLLRVESRRADVAVLRFTGISRGTIAQSLVIEAALVAGFGAAAGAGIAAVVTTIVNWHYQRLFDTTLRFAMLTGETVLLASGLSLVLGVAAGAIAAWRLVRIPPVELWGRRG